MVNRRIFLVLLSLGIALGTFAAKKKGAYITPAGDTVEATFRVPVNLFAKTPNYEQLQWKVSILGPEGRKEVLGPEQASEFFFSFRSLQVRMVSVPNILNASNAGAPPGKRLFMQLVKGENIRLLRFYQYGGYAGTDPSTPDPVLKEAPGATEIYFVLQPDGSFYQLRDEELCDPFPDCFH